MCNCKGWDIAFYRNDEITVQEHFCRILDDCGHIDNTLEEAADEVSSEYDKLHDWYCDAHNRGIVEVKDSRLDFFLEQSRMWKNRTHESYLYYANPQKDEEF